MMGGRGSWSLTATSFSAPKTNYELETINGRTVGEILDEATSVGAIRYVKPLREFKESEDDGKDLFAHAALYLDGWRFEVPKERNSKNTDEEEWRQFQRSIDIIRTDNGEYWEIKSPPPGGRWNNTRSVERGLRAAEEQFAGHPVARSQPRRVVFNGRHLNASDEAISQRIDLEMRLQGGFREVVQVRKDGSLQYHPPRA